MNHLYTRRPDVVEMILLNNREMSTELAWEWLRLIGIIKSASGRPEWKEPTSPYPRMIAFGFTKIETEVDGETIVETYDGDISYGSKKVAVFRFGRFE
jgi:hypothetical protein